MNPVVHFEMPAKDRQRMVAFYEKVFGWQTNQMGEEMGHYVVVSTTETGEYGRPLRPGAINGGFYPVPSNEPLPAPSFVIAVDDIKASMAEVTQAGGTVHGEPSMIPMVGLYVSITDTEGNRASLLQPIMNGSGE